MYAAGGENRQTDSVMFCITAIYDGRRVLFSGEVPGFEQVSNRISGLASTQGVSTHPEFGSGADQRGNLIYPAGLPPEVFVCYARLKTLFNFFLNVTNPSNPEPRSNIVEGSGTGAFSSTGVYGSDTTSVPPPGVVMTS